MRVGVVGRWNRDKERFKIFDAIETSDVDFFLMQSCKYFSAGLLLEKQINSKKILLKR